MPHLLLCRARFCWQWKYGRRGAAEEGVQDVREEVPRRVPVQVVPQLGEGRELPALPERLELRKKRREEKKGVFSVSVGVTFEKEKEKLERKTLSLLLSSSLFLISIQ